MRRFTLTALGLLCLGVTGCSDALPATSPSVSTPTRTPVPDYAANAFVLRGLVTVPYIQGQNGVASMSAGEFASQFGTQAMLAELETDGYSAGAMETLTQPADGAGAFDTIQSDALVFSSKSGAETFYTAEAQRLTHPSAGGAATPVADAPTSNLEHGTVLREAHSAVSASLPSYLALGVRGRVIIVLLGEAATPTVAPSAFFQLLRTQENSLSGIPE